MIKPFLQKLAEEIANRYSDDPGQVCIVLPNRRAGLYLKKYLAAALQKTVWSPQTYSIEDFITNLSGCQVIDPVGLLFEFYRVHKEVQGEKAQEFELFSDWAQTVLKDFDEIDQYLIDPEKIFNYLNAARALTVWNLDEKPLTDQEIGYIEFYRSFLTYYQHLQKNLEEKRLAYPGMAYRIAANQIEKKTDELKWKKIMFAGLNALSGAEEKIIGHLVHEGKAEIYWDADEYYVRNEYQEAGSFIRRYLQKWPSDPVKWLENNFITDQKTIRVYGVPGSMGQAQKAGQIVKHLQSADIEPDKTALVLADEKLLLPVLYSLPDEMGPVNVTMGYPFKLTQLYHLVNLLFTAQENAEKFAARRKNSGSMFYVKDILNLLAHPYLQLINPFAEAGQITFDEISNLIRKKNRVFMSPAELLRFSVSSENPYRDFSEKVFQIWENPGTGLTEVLAIMSMIRDRIIALNQEVTSSYSSDLEQLYHFSRIIKRCRTMMETYPFVNTLTSLHKILFELLDLTKLPFSGEPLRGLQIMGVLETRAIDFENLVVLSVNEGILPSGKHQNSFIPFDIKKEFGLPTYQHKDEVFAYHFYHMLQRVKTIYLLYDTEGDQMKGGEKSRYISQIAYELPKLNPGADYKEELLRPFPPDKNQAGEIIVPKSPSIIARLREKCEKGFSPTALNVYIRCPLKFYYQEILRLSEAETIEETIEARTMGTAVHQVFEEVFNEYVGRFADPGSLTAKLSETEHLLLQAFSQHYKDGDLDFGKNHLVFKASLFLVNQFILHEAELLKNSGNPPGALKIIALESSFERQVQCEVEGNPMNVKIKGKTDRIDQWEGVTRIIDYKTGNVSVSELNLKSWDKLITDPKMSKAFQLLLYAWLYFRNQGAQDERLQTGNYSLRKISAGFMKVKLPDGAAIDKESMELFEQMLIELLEQILDPTIPFIQTPEAENCTYCPFTAICTR